MPRRLRSYVCGEWKEGTGEGVPLHDPTTGRVIAETSTGGIDLPSALSHAREKGGPALRELCFAERGSLLSAMASTIHRHREELLDLARLNGGNTRGDAKFDIDGATGTLSFYAGLGSRLGEGRFLIDGGSLRLSRSPRFVGAHVLLPLRGAAIQINAFNFPAWGLAEKAAASLLAGMPVVTKPGTSTALVAARIAEILVGDAILPEGAFAFIAGPAGDLLDHVEDQDVIAFTGSAETGTAIRSREDLVRKGVRINLEADSLNSAVLGPDVETGSETWDFFLHEVVHEMTQKSGQKCTAVRRIFVPESLLDAAGQALGAALKAQRVGNPTVGEVRVGPLANAAQIEGVLEGIGKLGSAAEIVHGAEGPGELVDVVEGEGWFQQPVLLLARKPEVPHLVHELEVFGPVATLMPYDGSVEDAGRLVALGRGSLVASVYTEDRDFAAGMMERIGSLHGRLYFGSRRIAGHSMGPGTVLPQLVHGGPGRAGGGEELGGLFGMELYLQRCALQGDDPMIARILEGGRKARTLLY